MFSERSMLAIILILIKIKYIIISSIPLFIKILTITEVGTYQVCAGLWREKPGPRVNTLPFSLFWSIY